MPARGSNWPKENVRQADRLRSAGRQAAATDGPPWEDDDFDPAREPWEPEPLDDEPQPEPGDFWLEADAFDE